MARSVFGAEPTRTMRGEAPFTQIMGNCEAVAAVVSASDKDSRTAGLYDTGDVKGDGRTYIPHKNGT